MRRLASLAGLLALVTAEAAQAQMDPNNPTCPVSLNVSNYREMRFTPHEVDGRKVLLAEGYIDDGVPARLQQALDSNPDIGEIWFRSPGGVALAGNQAGMIIRNNGMVTRIPAGWVCFSACNFMFMGGMARFVDEGGIFMVHMFTHTQDREAIRSNVAQGEDSTISLISQIEQQSAQLATEDNDFLIRMGISRDLLRNVMYRVSAVPEGENHETRRCLTQQEVRLYNVETEIIGN